MPDDEEWRILAEEAALEKDPAKLLEVVTALNRVLDEQERQKKHRHATGKMDEVGRLLHSSRHTYPNVVRVR